jgi:starch synthase
MRNEFTGVVEKDGEWFIAYCPEIPGANGQGRTTEEALGSLAGAIALILEDRREEGLRGVYLPTRSARWSPCSEARGPARPAPRIPASPVADCAVAGPGAIGVTGLGSEHFNSAEFEHFGTFNIMKAALHHATMVSTVSPTYAREIQTSAHGFGLDGVLRGRAGDLRGILNGIDVHEWDPTRDPHLPAHFDADDLTGKAACKAALQREAGLAERDDVPVFGLVSRLIRQKGLDVLLAALERILALDLQVVALGTGDADLEAGLARFGADARGRLRFFREFNNARAHRIEAGADFFLMPSRFEPCGLNQMYSLRYGTLPLVRATGGLADTVVNYDERARSGTGFVMGDLNPSSLFDTVGWAVSTWYDRPDDIARMRRVAMAVDNSWEHAAREYEALYREAVARRRRT